MLYTYIQQHLTGQDTLVLSVFPTAIIPAWWTMTSSVVAKMNVVWLTVPQWLYAGHFFVLILCFLCKHDDKSAYNVLEQALWMIPYNWKLVENLSRKHNTREMSILSREFINALNRVNSKGTIRNRKCKDYVYGKWEYWSTMLKIKHFLRHENKVNGMKYHHTVGH